jgi:hypothetical protein
VDAGRLSVNYIAREKEAWKCARGAPCKISVRGSYQRDSDAVMLADRDLACAGKKLRVQGSSRGYSQTGIYEDEGIKIQNRPVYRNIDPEKEMYLFYNKAGDPPDEYFQWIMGEDYTAEGPEEAYGTGYQIDKELRDESGNVKEMPVELITATWTVWESNQEVFVRDAAVTVYGARYPGFAINPQRSDKRQCELGHHKWLQNKKGPILAEYGTAECGQVDPNMTDVRTPAPTPVAWNFTMPDYRTPNGTEHPAAKVVLPPIVTTMPFDFGIAYQSAVYRVCYCTPGWDGDCHGDASYLVDSGLLVVQVARGKETWLCRENCTLEVRFWQHTSLDLIMLQPVDQGECHFAKEQTQLFEFGTSEFDILNPEVVRYGGPDTLNRIWAKELINTESGYIDEDTGEERFTNIPTKSNRQEPTRMYDVRVRDPGFYFVCACTAFEGERDTDLLPCTTYSEFFQTAGIVKIGEAEFFEILEETWFYFQISAADLPTQPNLGPGEVRIISIEDECGDPDAARAQGDDAVPGQLIENNTIIRYDVGVARQRAEYLICYCMEACRDKDGYSIPKMYDMVLGTVEVQIILPETHFCVAGRNCSVILTGYQLSGTDRLLLSDKMCGDDVGKLGIYSDEIHVPLQDDTWVNGTLDFYLGVLPKPHVTRKCFCEPANGNSAICISPLFFGAKAGLLVVAGPTPRQTFYCMFGVRCQFDVKGVELRRPDQVRLVNLTVTGGTKRALNAADGVCTGSNAEIDSAIMQLPISTGPYGGTRVKDYSGHGIDWEQTYADFQDIWEAGVDLEEVYLPRMTYAVCYCVGTSECGGNKTDVHPFISQVTQSPPESYAMAAGVLTVSGPDMEQQFSCVTGSPCTIVVRGWALTKRDFVAVSLLRGPGDEEGVCAGARPRQIRPNPVQGSMDTGGIIGAMTLQPFEISTVNMPFEELFLCYCVPPWDGDADGLTCDGFGDFPFSFGFLSVRGAKGTQEFGCVLGEECDVEIEGVVLRESDRIAAFDGPCGGNASSAPTGAFSTGPTSPEPGNKSIICTPQWINGSWVIGAPGQEHEHGRRRSSHGDPPHDHLCPREPTIEGAAAAGYISTQFEQMLNKGGDITGNVSLDFDHLTYRLGITEATGTVQLCLCVHECDADNPEYTHSAGVVHVVECPGVGNPANEQERRRELEYFVPDTDGVFGNARDPQIKIWADDPLQCANDLFEDTLDISQQPFYSLQEAHGIRYATSKEDCYHHSIPEVVMPGIYQAELETMVVPVRTGVSIYPYGDAKSVSLVEGYGLQLDIRAMHYTLFWTQCPRSWIRFQSFACTPGTLWETFVVLFALVPACLLIWVLQKTVRIVIGVPKGGFLRFIYRTNLANNGPVADLARSASMINYLSARKRWAVHLPYPLVVLFLVKIASLLGLVYIVYLFRTGSEADFGIPMPECKAGIPILAVCLVGGAIFLNICLQYIMLVFAEKDFDRTFVFTREFCDTLRATYASIRGVVLYIWSYFQLVYRYISIACSICRRKKRKVRASDPLEPRSPGHLNDPLELKNGELKPKQIFINDDYTTRRERLVVKTLVGAVRELKIYLDTCFVVIAFQCYFDLYYWAFSAVFIYLLTNGVLYLSLWNAYMEARGGGLRWVFLAILPQALWPEDDNQDDEGDEQPQKVEETKPFVAGARFSERADLDAADEVEEEPETPMVVAVEEAPVKKGLLARLCAFMCCGWCHCCPCCRRKDPEEEDCCSRRCPCCPCARRRPSEKYAVPAPVKDHVLGSRELGAPGRLRPCLLCVTRRQAVAKPGDPTEVWDKRKKDRREKSGCCRRKDKPHRPAGFDMNKPPALWRRLAGWFYPGFFVDFFEELFMSLLRTSRPTPAGSRARVSARLESQRLRGKQMFWLLNGAGAWLVQEGIRPALTQRLGTDISGVDGRLFLLQLLGCTFDVTALEVRKKNNNNIFLDV